MILRRKIIKLFYSEVGRALLNKNEEVFLFIINSRLMILIFERVSMSKFKFKCSHSCWQLSLKAQSEAGFLCTFTERVFTQEN